LRLCGASLTGCITTYVMCWKQHERHTQVDRRRFVIQQQVVSVSEIRRVMSLSPEKTVDRRNGAC
jgi:hypothetical protein